MSCDGYPPRLLICKSSPWLGFFLFRTDRVEIFPTSNISFMQEKNMKLAYWLSIRMLIKSKYPNMVLVIRLYIGTLNCVGQYVHYKHRSRNSGGVEKNPGFHSNSRVVLARHINSTVFSLIKCYCCRSKKKKKNQYCNMSIDLSTRTSAMMRK